MGKVEIEILPGVRHYETSGFAYTWGAYDALTVEDGWEEKRTANTAGETVWKLGTVNGRRFVVHSPFRSRERG